MGNIGMDILKTDAPICKYFMSMNRLYLLLDMNNECYRGQDFTTMTLVITMYNEDSAGELNPDDVVWSWNRTYERHMLTEVKEEVGLPYNFYIDIDNYWGEIQLNYNYNYDDGTGGNNYSSKMSKYTFDNRQTVLVSQEVTPFFKDRLKDNITKNREVNVWFGSTSANSDYVVNDLISDTRAGMIKQIVNVSGVYPSQSIIVIPAEKNYMGLITYILNHDGFSSVIARYFDSGIPTSSTFTFKLFVNQYWYLLHLRGDLRDLSYL